MIGFFVAEFARHGFHHGFHVVLVILRHGIEDALQGEALIGAVLDCGPYIVIHNMELREKAPVRNVLEAVRGKARALDEILHHLHALHIGAFFVHGVHLVLPPFHQVLLGHRADSVGLVDDVILEVPIPAVNGVIGTHHHAQHQPLFLVLHGVELRPFRGRLLEGEEVALHGGVVHQGDTQHPRVPFRFHKRLVHGNAVYCNYVFCHFPAVIFLEIPAAANL